MPGVLGGMPHKLELITGCSLQVDHENYQRQPNMEKVKKYSENWSDVAGGVIIVSRRRDGSDWIIDGQHRVLALMMKDGPSVLVVCMTYEGLTIQQESDAFSKTNGERGPVTKRVWVKSRLTADDPRWKKVVSILNEESTPWTLGSRNNRTYVLSCWGSVEKILSVKKHDGYDVLRLTLRFLRDAFGNEPESLDGRVLAGAADFLIRHREEILGREKEIAEKLKLSGFAAVRAQKCALLAVKRADQRLAPHVAWSQAICDTFNSGKRTRRIGDTESTKSVLG